ncbi:MAG: class I poly(R)-hydroxyalkanoic acid synthase, partial [Pseudomonadota bacterium]
MSEDKAKAAASAIDSAAIFAEVAQRSGRIMQGFFARQSKMQSPVAADEFGIAKAFMDLSARMLANPQHIAEAQMNMFWDYARLWQSGWMQMMGQKVEPIAAPRQGDNRFRHKDWEEHFLFDYFKQSYLIAARHIHEAVSKVEDLPDEARKKVDFFTRQYIDALSPSNFALTNPEVVRETLNSGGQNLLRGLNNLLADIERGDGQLQI